jgi:hypothetical protein
MYPTFRSILFRKTLKGNMGTSTLTFYKLKEFTFKNPNTKIWSQFSSEVTFTLSCVSMKELNCSLYLQQCASHLILCKCSSLWERHAKWISARKRICVHWCKENTNKIFATQSEVTFLRMLIFLPCSSFPQWWDLESTVLHFGFHRSQRVSWVRSTIFWTKKKGILLHLCSHILTVVGTSLEKNVC